MPLSFLRNLRVFLAVIFIFSGAQSTQAASQPLDQNSNEVQNCQFLDFIHFNIIQIPQKSYIRNHESYDYIDKEKTTKLWYSLCHVPPKTVLDICEINLKDYTQESNSLKLRRIVAVEILPTNAQGATNCNVITLANLSEIHYTKVGIFKSFEQMLPNPRVREGITMNFNKYSLKLYVQQEGKTNSKTLTSSLIALNLPLEPQRDTPKINLVFPWSRGEYSNPLFWLIKVVNFLILLPLFLLRRVGQEYHFFEFMAFWLAVNWIFEISMELLTIGFNFTFWMGWPLLFCYVLIVASSFLMVKYCLKPCAPFFICK